MIKSTLNFFTLAVLALFMVGCSKDDDVTENGTQFVAAFENQSISFSSEETEKEIQIIFSEAAPQDGEIQVGYKLTNMVYGEDFNTSPAANQGIIQIPVKAGAKKASFKFNKLTPNPLINDPEKSIEFSIVKINIPNGITQGNTNLLVSYSETASLGGSFAPNVGGPNEPNQVYIDLSTQSKTEIVRDTWDLGFYSGDEFRVKLNSSLFMMAAKLETTDINSVSASDLTELQGKMALMAAGADAYVDDPSGDISKTAIAEVSATVEENKVYLINMGSAIGTKDAEIGSVAISGEARGWKKIRVIREDNGYLLQYADLNATEYKEISIPKDSNFNFSFFSFSKNAVVAVEPTKENWDLNFTTATEILALGPVEKTAYGFSDYVKTNIHGGTEVYLVLATETTYEDFTIENIQEDKFQTGQGTIGSSWRDVFEAAASPNQFYIIKDPEGNIYKLKFTALVSKDGVRGNPEFQYDLLK